MSSDFVSRKEWYEFVEAQRRADFARKEKRDKEAHLRWKAENVRLLNPPPPPPKPKRPPGAPDISDNSFADYQFARGGLVELETKEDDEEIVREHRARRSSTIKSKGSKRLVDSYRD